MCNVQYKQYYSRLWVVLSNLATRTQEPPITCSNAVVATVICIYDRTLSDSHLTSPHYHVTTRANALSSIPALYQYYSMLGEYSQ